MKGRLVMNICSSFVLRGCYSPVIVLCPPWLPDMGFTPGALVQVLPEAGGLFFILCDENIRKYSELLLATEAKKGELTTVDCCNLRGIMIAIDSYCISNAGLDFGDNLIVQYEYGLIRVRKLTDQLEPLEAEF